MFWEILGIEPTTDKKEITMAYRSKLVTTNPEDKPEEFKALREAYELALEYAENDGEVASTPLEQWVKKLEDVYFDYPSRINVECWKELLSDDICQGLGTKIQVEEALLKFFMEHYFMSHEVWVYLNDFFGFLDHIDSLYESFPRDFIDNIIVGGVSYDDTLPLTMFSEITTEEETRSYLDLYNSVRRVTEEEKAELIKQLAQHHLSHPYGESMILYETATMNSETFDKLEQIVVSCDYDSTLASALANRLNECGEFDRAIELCNKALEKRETARLLWNLANGLAGKEEYSDAIEKLHILMDYADGDQRQIHDIYETRSEWNEKLIEKYQRIYQENPEDNDNTVSLTWALLQNDRYEEARELSEHINEEVTDPFDYNNLLSNIELFSDNYESGLEKLEKLIEITKNLKEEDNPKNAKRMKRIPEFLARKGYFLFSHDDVDGGFEAYKQAIEANPADVDILTQMVRFCLAFRKYEDAEKYAREAVYHKQTAYHSHFLLADALFRQHKDSESFAEVNKAIDLYGSDLECYALKLRLLVRNGAKEAAYNLVQFLDENGVGDDLTIRYCKASMKEYFENDREGAYEIYQQIMEQIKTGEYCAASDEVFYRYVVILTTKSDARKKEDRDLVLQYIDEGLKYNSEHMGLLDYKAWYLYKDETTKDEALKIYLDLEKRDGHSSEIEYQIASIYYDDLDNHVEDALKYYLAAYERGRTDTLFYITYCYYFMGNNDEAEKYCLLFREDEANRNVVDVDSYHRMSYIYEARKQLDKALAEAEIAIEKANEKHKENENFKVSYYYNHKIRLLRMLNRFDEAMDTAREMMTVAKVDNVPNLITEIMIQKGDYEGAKKYIKELLRRNNDHNDAVKNQLLLSRVTEHFNSAKLTLFNYAGSLSDYVKREANESIYTHDCDFNKLVKSREKEVERRKKEGLNLAHGYIQLAEAYDKLGDQLNATKYALLADELLPKERGKYTLVPALYYIYEARIQIVFNNFDKAEELLEKARNSTCNNCSYCGCKDADLMEVELLLKKGLYKQAEEKAVEGMSKWRDEADYASILPYIRKKGQGK